MKTTPRRRSSPERTRSKLAPECARPVRIDEIEPEALLEYVDAQRSETHASEPKRKGGR
jgi:hypothetical protein